jgi:hypothetical protein
MAASDTRWLGRVAPNSMLYITAGLVWAHARTYKIARQPIISQELWDRGRKPVPCDS